MDGNVLTPKEKALVSLSASVAAGCRPCTEYHTTSVRESGACERSLTLAVETALAVRSSATKAMDDWAAACQGTRQTPDAEFVAQKRLVAKLAAVAAAVSVNSVPDLRAHLEGAAEAGATPEQIRAAVGIANSIRRTAEQKITDVLGEAVKTAESCCAPKPEATNSGAATGCGCR